MLAAETRHAAIDELLKLLGTAREQARTDPTGTLVQVGSHLWTIVSTGTSSLPTDEPSSLRRAGAKHRRVR